MGLHSLVAPFRHRGRRLSAVGAASARLEEWVGMLVTEEVPEPPEPAAGQNNQRNNQAPSRFSNLRAPQNGPKTQKTGRSRFDQISCPDSAATPATLSATPSRIEPPPTRPSPPITGGGRP